MNLRQVFGEKLVYNELYSNEDFGGGYPLQIGTIRYGVNSKSKLKVQDIPYFSQSLKQELAVIYEQVYEMFFLWELQPQSDTLILADEWLKKEYLEQGYDLPSMREELSGMMKLIPLDEMIDDKSHVFWLNSNIERYYPFDVHYNLTACLKKWNGIVENNIYIYHNRIPKVFDMKVTIMDYLDLAYQSKAFYNWQMAYINRSGGDWEKMRRMLPKIFPNLTLDLGRFGM